MDRVTTELMTMATVCDRDDLDFYTTLEYRGRDGERVFLKCERKTYAAPWAKKEDADRWFWRHPGGKWVGAFSGEFGKHRALVDAAYAFQRAPSVIDFQPVRK